MTRLAPALLGFWMGLSAATTASGDQIQLKTGGILRGTVVAETRETVTLKASFGTAAIDRSQIVRIIKEAAAVSPAPASPTICNPPSPPPSEAETPLAPLPSGPDPFEDRVKAALKPFKSMAPTPEHEGAATHLAALGAEAIPAMAALFNEARMAQQYWIIEVIGRLGDHAGDNTLLGALHHSEPSIRAAACRALPLVKSGVATGPLTTMLRDQDWRVRLEAVKALTAYQHRGAVPALIARLDDERFDVRSAAHEGLITLTEENLPPDREAWLEWLARNPIGKKEFKDLRGRPLDTRRKSEDPAP